MSTAADATSPGRFPAVAANLAAGLVAAAGAWVAVRTAFPDGPSQVGDAHVYVDTLAHVDAGGAVYDFATTNGLGFTYPPVAVLLLRPLAWVPPAVFDAAWALVCLAALAWAAWALSGALQPLPLRRPVLAAATLGALGLSVQAQSGLVSGNVSVLIVAACLADVGQAWPRRARGLLVGVAAAVKLTPLAFVLALAALRERRAAARALSTVLALTLLGIAAFPEASRRYWTEVVVGAEGIGDQEYAGNQSATGALARLGLDHTTASILGIGAGAVVLIVALWWVHETRGAVHPAAAAVAVGCASTVMSPFSWPFHLLWLPLAGVVLVAARRWADVALGVLVLGLCTGWGLVASWLTAVGAGALAVELPVLLSAAVALRGPVPVRGALLPRQAGPRWQVAGPRPRGWAS